MGGAKKGDGEGTGEEKQEDRNHKGIGINPKWVPTNFSSVVPSVLQILLYKSVADGLLLILTLNNTDLSLTCHC